MENWDDDEYEDKDIDRLWDHVWAVLYAAIIAMVWVAIFGVPLVG